ncbi:MAG: Sec-independent protein translocase subunit TatA/TatB, partial [Armatimonadota bacterium]
MGSIQFPEIVIILLLALLLFGPKKLPEIGRTLGSAMRELRKAAQEFSASVEQL